MNCGPKCKTIKAEEKKRRKSLISKVMTSKVQSTKPKTNKRNLIKIKNLLLCKDPSRRTKTQATD
jgi:hypothetical protein